jgi:hypothetical protein
MIMSAFCDALCESLLPDNISFNMVDVKKNTESPTNPEDKKCNNNLMSGLNL